MAGLSKINSDSRTKNYLPVKLFAAAILKSYTSDLIKKQGLGPLSLSLGWG